MDKIKFYSVNSLSIPINQRNEYGVYFLKTPDGFTVYRVADNINKDFIPLDIPSGVESITGTGVNNTDPSNPTISIDKDIIGLGNVDNTQQIPLADKGANNGVAELDSNGKVPVSQLPSYVSDVETYPTLSSFPATGVDNIIYITEDTNLTYRWTGSAYVEISPSIALGETSSTAYRGDRGKTAYDHSQLTSGNPHNVTKTDVGLSNVDNTSDANKPISTATQNALNGKVDVGAGIPLSTVLYADNVAPIPIVLDYASLVFDQSSENGGKIHLMGTEGFDAGTYYQELQNKSGTIALLSDIVTLDLDAVVSVSGLVYSSPIMIIGDMFKISGDGGFYFTTLNSDNTSDRTQTLQDKDGIIALLSDIQEGGLVIEDITYALLAELKYQKQLVPGTRYYITDRDIWIDALDTNKLAMECKRHFSIVKDEHYTPHTVTNFFTSNYLGIYGQTIARGSVPNSVLAGNRYFAIWGGRMWMRNTSGSDVPGTSGTTIQGGWTMLAVTDNTYYESKIFDIKYNFDDDIIWEQSDDRGNKIKRLDSTTSYIDITDWGCTKIYNNQCIGIFDNFNNGDIFNNSNSNFIFDNSNNGNIANNSNNGNIRKNRNGGSIESNSNNGDIQDNTNNGAIQYNLNNGYIQNNTSAGSTTLTIRNNMNNGHIQRNNSTSNIYIYYNIHNGNVGTTTTLNRSSSIQDSQTNK